MRFILKDGRFEMMRGIRVSPALQTLKTKPEDQSMRYLHYFYRSVNFSLLILNEKNVEGGGCIVCISQPIDYDCKKTQFTKC